MATTIRREITLEAPRTTTGGGNAYPRLRSLNARDGLLFELLNGADGHWYGSVITPEVVASPSNPAILLVLGANATSPAQARINVSAKFVAFNGDPYSFAEFDADTIQTVVMAGSARNTIQKTWNAGAVANFAVNKIMFVDIFRNGADGANDNLAAPVEILKAFLQFDIPE